MSTAITKDDAHAEVLRLWRALPATERQSFAQARAFAIQLEPVIEFRTMGNKANMIAAWLDHDLLELAEVRPTGARQIRGTPPRKAAG